MRILSSLKAFFSVKRTKQSIEVESVRIFNPYDSFRIEVDDCIFLINQYLITTDTVSPVAGFWKNFDVEERNYNNTLQVKISKNINGVECHFVSNPMLIDKENLRIKIGLEQNSFVFYNRDNPSQYYFQL
jgi:hypothetical protein